MTPEQQTVRKQWVAALRSGKYKQGTHVLCHTDPETKEKSYCCLGVLCELYAEKHTLEKGEACPMTLEDRVLSPTAYGNDEDYQFLPICVRVWAGLYNDNGGVNMNFSLKLPLAWLNDHCKKTFNELADIIESDDSYFV